VDVTVVLGTDPAANGAAVVGDKLPTADEVQTKCFSGVT